MSGLYETRVLSVRAGDNVEKRLLRIRGESAVLRASLRILNEHVAHAQDVADDATSRALVASTPLADRERREAEDDLGRARRQRDETTQELGELLGEQDALLERLVPPTGDIEGGEEQGERG